MTAHYRLSLPYIRTRFPSHSLASHFILSHTHTVRSSSRGLLLPVCCWQTGSHHAAPAPQPSGCQDDDTVPLPLSYTSFWHSPPPSHFLPLNHASLPHWICLSPLFPFFPPFACSLHLFVCHPSVLTFVLASTTSRLFSVSVSFSQWPLFIISLPSCMVRHLQRLTLTTDAEISSRSQHAAFSSSGVLWIKFMLC